MYLSPDNEVLYVYARVDDDDLLRTEDVKQAIDGVFNVDLAASSTLRLIPANCSMDQLYEWYS